MTSGSVSIITPAYNQSSYLREAVQSAIEQTYHDIEIIVVDDGSTDQTRQVAESFSDSRVRYFYQTNQGLSAARNTGIRLAQGDFITFLDSDDLFLPDKIECLVAEMVANPLLGFAAGQAYLIDPDGNQLGLMDTATVPDDPTKFLFGNPLHVGSVLIRRHWVEKAGLFDASLRACEDWDLWLRLIIAGCKMKGVAKPVSLYRLHPAQMTRDPGRMRTAMMATLDKTFQREDLPAGWREEKSKAYSAAFIKAAARYYHSEKYQEARSDLSRAVQLDPSLLDKRGQMLANLLAGWATAPFMKDPVTKLDQVFRNLPDELNELRQDAPIHLSSLALDMAYRHYRSKELVEARHDIIRAVRYQPSLIMNRGLISILLQSYFSPR
jgi:hypothetical protein